MSIFTAHLATFTPNGTRTTLSLLLHFSCSAHVVIFAVQHFVLDQPPALDLASVALFMSFRMHY